MKAVTVAALLVCCTACTPGPPPDPARDIVALATAHVRPVAGRLANAPHAPWRGATRSASAPDVNVAVLNAAARAQLAARREPDAANLRTLGLGYLVIGEREKAVQLLEDSAALAPNASTLNDLAVAYLALADPQRPDILPRAVEAADRALRADAASHEARFNLAVAFERLHLPREAAAIWSDYLRSAMRDGWAIEAAERLDTLRRALDQTAGRMSLLPKPGERARDLTRVLAAVRREPDDAVRDSILFEWLERKILPEWPAAWSAGAHEAHALVAPLLALVRDGLAGGPDGEIGRALECMVAATDARDHGGAGRAFSDYSEGVSALAANSLAQAEAYLRRASRVLHVRCGVGYLWAEHQRGWVEYAQARYGAARDRFARVIAAAARAQYSRTLALAYRARANASLVEQDNGAALGDLEAGLVHARRTGDLALSGRLLSNLADTLDIEGRRRESWDARVAGLEAAARFPAADAGSSVYRSTGYAAAREQQTRLALALVSAEEAISTDQSSSIANFLLEWRRTDLNTERGDVPAARASLARADRLLVDLRHDSRVRTLATVIDPARAALEAEAGGPAAGLAQIDRAIAVLNDSVASRAARLRLTRTKLLVAQGDAAGAIGELHSVIALLQRMSTGSFADTLEASTTRELVGATRLLVDSLLREQRASEALSVWSTVRAALNGAQVVPPAAPGRAALIQYAVLDRRVVAWVTASGTTRVVDLDLAALRRAKSRLDTAVLDGAAPSLLTEAFAALYDVLIRPLPPFPDGIEHITVVPDEVIASLPFGSLFDRTTRRHLFEVALVTMAWDAPERFDLGHRAGIRALVVADPGAAGARATVALPSARAEADAVARFYERPLLMQAGRATADGVLAALPEADIVHWAGHAVIDETDGRRSYFAVAAGADGMDRLTADRVARVRMRPGSIVVLAACRSIDAPYRAFHARSLGHAFHRAGARAVIGVVFDIPDAPSRRFFEALHQALARGEPAAVALQSVQRQFVKQQSQDASVALAAAVYVK